MTATPTFRSLRDFYPYYLGQHQHPVCRRLHFIGTGLIPVWVVVAAVNADARWLWLIPAVAYGMAWIGHAFFERNRPATFTHPFYSLASDMLLFFDLLRGREPFDPRTRP